MKEKIIEKNQLLTIFGHLSNIHKFYENQTKYSGRKISLELVVYKNLTWTIV
jgi:hypothetical protein